jgi:hypothetical protein
MQQTGEGVTETNGSSQKDSGSPSQLRAGRTPAFSKLRAFGGRRRSGRASASAAILLLSLFFAGFLDQRLA